MISIRRAMSREGVMMHRAKEVFKDFYAVRCRTIPATTMRTARISPALHRTLVRPGSGKLGLLLAVLPPVLDAMAMMLDAGMGLRPNRAGLFGCPRALVLLRRAHRPHRQFETRTLLGAGRQGKRWNDDGESAKGDQPQRMMMHDVHGV